MPNLKDQETEKNPNVPTPQPNTINHPSNMTTTRCTIRKDIGVSTSVMKSVFEDSKEREALLESQEDLDAYRKERGGAYW